MKSYFKKLSYESKFSRKYACWCHNHCGISKVKKTNRQQARQKLREQLKRDIEEQNN